MTTSKQTHPGQWRQEPALPEARSHCPTAVYKGRVFGFGGGGPAFKSMNSTIIFDPASNQWNEGTAMPTLRSGAIARTVGDDIYIIGGGFKQPDDTFRFLHTTDIYHPDSDSWSSGPDMIMPHDYPGGVVHDGYFYILGGHHPDATLSGPKTDPGFPFCERLNLATGTWEEIAPLPTPRFALEAVVMDDKIVTFGGVAFTPEGFNNFSHLEVYDPASNSWSQAEVELPWTAAGAGACIADGKLFIFGGYSGDGISDHAACYDPDTNEWQLLPAIPQPLCAMGVAVIGKSIYLLGGWADDGRTPQDVCFQYSF